MKRKILAALLAGVVAFSFAAFTGCVYAPQLPPTGDNNKTPGNTEDNTQTPGDGSGDQTQTPGDGNNTQKPEEGNGDGDGEEKPTSTKLTGKVYVVGDSTVCSFNDNYYIPRYGYGTQLYRYLNCDSNRIVNLAMSGRSSLSFLTESNYNTLKTSISAGDYLVVGFGHNDEKSDDSARYTNPTKSYTDDSTANGPSFQYTLYQNYVKLATDKGATPILCTPIVRYDSKGAYTGSVVHNTSAGDYAQAIKKLGTDTQTTVIDLTTITKDIYKADNEAAAYFHAHTTYKGEGTDKTPAGMDGTHINEYGAKVVAYNFANALKSTNCSLKNHLNLEATAPTYEVDYKAAINESYKKPDYTQFNPANYASAKITTTGEGENEVNWYKTAFGDLGGNNNYKYYTATYADSKFSVGNNGLVDGETKDCGKFKESYDSLGAAFIQIDAKYNFKASATVKVVSNSQPSSSESGFGMMLRDDIYMNLNSNAISTNYVAAGVQKDCAIFSRENMTLTKYGSGNSSVNTTYEISIERLGQVVTVKTGSTTKTFTDFDFQAVDNDYMYLCLFATRGIVAEFSDVSFEITGISQGA